MLLVFINIRSNNMCGFGYSSLIHVVILFHLSSFSVPLEMSLMTSTLMKIEDFMRLKESVKKSATSGTQTQDSHSRLLRTIMLATEGLGSVASMMGRTSLECESVRVPLVADLFTDSFHPIKSFIFISNILLRCLCLH